MASGGAQLGKSSISPDPFNTGGGSRGSSKTPEDGGSIPDVERFSDGPPPVTMPVVASEAAAFDYGLPVPMASSMNYHRQYHHSPYGMAQWNGQPQYGGTYCYQPPFPYQSGYIYPPMATNLEQQAPTSVDNLLQQIPH